ncbi:hypothetical protein M3Y98_00020300 [Aphelenchoides besseyi]|nr:hypothetical protein M3Y98_00020300 [Aphelenchoides besseyi]KAI6199245.1 hypothetical protein M3Y96_00606200 [Aphelenchoides besseyi]
MQSRIVGLIFGFLLLIIVLWTFIEDEQPVHIAYRSSMSANTWLKRDLLRFQSKQNDEFKDRRFVRPAETEHVPCDKVFNPNVDRFSLARKYRVKYDDPREEAHLPMDCKSIKKRNNFYEQPLSEAERDFPLAYARNIFSDYRFIEMELSTTYAPQNHYCFSIDGNSSPIFRKRMMNLSRCFPNIYITNLTLRMDSAGHNTNAHHQECLKILGVPSKEWRYVMLLQNYDVMLKTNQELVQILTWYNGTNDVTTEVRTEVSRFKRTFNSLKLFKDPKRNFLTVNGIPPTLGVTRSFVQNTMSREAIDFILEKLNLNLLIELFNAEDWTGDEYLTSTLNSDDNIQLPGGFTRRCKQSGIIIGKTRYNVWIRNKTICDSQLWRHNACIFGLEDLRPKFVDNPFFIANKLMPSYDFAAITCLHEVVFNRTYHDRGFYRLNKDEYVKLPQVRFNKQRNRLGASFDPGKFDCTKHQNEYIGTNILRSGLRIIET